MGPQQGQKVFTLQTLPVSHSTLKHCISLIEYWTSRYFARLSTYTAEAGSLALCTANFISLPSDCNGLMLLIQNTASRARAAIVKHIGGTKFIQQMLIDPSVPSDTGEPFLLSFV